MTNLVLRRTAGINHKAAKGTKESILIAHVGNEVHYGGMKNVQTREAPFVSISAVFKEDLSTKEEPSRSGSRLLLNKSFLIFVL